MGCIGWQYFWGNAKQADVRRYNKRSPATKKIAIGVANSDFLISRIERLFCFEYQAYVDGIYSSVDIVVNRLNSNCVIEVELTSSSHQFYLHVCVEVYKCISVLLFFMLKLVITQ